MRKVKILCSALFILGTSYSAAFSSAGDLTGQWIVRWQNNPKNENAMSLALHEGRVSGTYINDDKTSCSVTGNIRAKTREFSLTIVCPKWDIRMQGTTSANWENASGSYQAYVNNQGKFMMKKA